MTVYALFGIFFGIAWFFWPISLLLVIGLIRLFYLGPGHYYRNQIQDQSFLRKGDVIITGRPSVTYSWYIQLSNVLTGKIENRFWTHAAIYQGDGKVWEAQSHGIVEKDVSEYLDDVFFIRVFRHKFIQDDVVFDRVLDFCRSNQGAKYGWAGVIFYSLSTFIPVGFNFLFKNQWIDQMCHLDDAYFCSELVVDAYAAAGYPISEYDGWRVKPVDFIHNPQFEEITA